jgi:hypothetical protein
MVEIVHNPVCGRIGCKQVHILGLEYDGVATGSPTRIASDWTSSEGHTKATDFRHHCLLSLAQRSALTALDAQRFWHGIQVETEN